MGEDCSGRCCAVPGQQRSPCSPLVPRAAAAAFVPVAVGQTRGEHHGFTGGKGGVRGADLLVLSYCSFPPSPGPSVGWGQRDNKKDLGEHSEDACRVQPGYNHIPTS